MNTPPARFLSSAKPDPKFSRPMESLFAQRFAATSGRSRFSASPRFRLIDPNLLDRLQSPLTRYHD
jgi:hypothetical protein